MKIEAETKYDVGDQVWVFVGEEMTLKRSKVRQVLNAIGYQIDGLVYREDVCFKTRQEAERAIEDEEDEE